MRIDPDHCRDPDLLAAEVRRLQAVIAAGQPTLTDEEREAIERVAKHCADTSCVDTARTLWGLLQRLGY